MKKHLLVTISLSILLFSVGSVSAMPNMSNDSKDAGKTTAGAPAAELLSGKVLQTMDSGGYSYIYLQKKNGEKVWVAVMQTPVKVGSQMSFKPGMEMQKFESKSLKRTFDKIIFSDGPLTTAPATAAKGVPAAPSVPAASSASPGSKGAVASKDTKIAVSKATGANAYTIEELYKNSAKLNGKKIVVKGKVIKVSSGIMGKNWIHIQDGSGSQAKGNHNLVCTSLGSADAGNVVTITGTLAKDRDFGAGYKYAVIVENATISKK